MKYINKISLVTLSKNSKVLTVFTLISIAILTATNYLLSGVIAKAEKEHFYRQIKVIDNYLSKDSYNNNLLESCYLERNSSQVAEPKLENLYLAKKNDSIVAYLLIYSTMQGYNGYIKNLLITDKEGKVIALKILEQKETPGLGSKVVDSDFEPSWAGKTLSQALKKELKVKKDGGVIPYYSGATITPRAIANATQAIMIEKVQYLIKNKNYLEENFNPCRGAKK